MPTKFYHETPFITPPPDAPIAEAPKCKPDTSCAALRKYRAARAEENAKRAAREAELEIQRLEAEQIQSDFGNKVAHRDGLKGEIAAIESLITGNNAQLDEWAKHFQANCGSKDLFELQEASLRLEWQKPHLETALANKRTAHQDAIKDVVTFAAKNGIALPE